eukprot:EG_transcript_9188
MVEGATAVSPVTPVTPAVTPVTPAVTPVTPAVTPLQARVLRRHGLALRCDAARGRYVVAARPLAAGEVALANQPYVTLAKADRCDYCFAKGTQTGLSACSRCHRASYCGRGCQEAAWKTHHKVECKAWKQLSAACPPSSSEFEELLVLLRVLFKAESGSSAAGVVSSSPGLCGPVGDDATHNGDIEEDEGPTFPDVQGMCSNRDADPDRWRSKVQLAVVLQPLVRPAIAVERLAELLCQMDCNNFAIWDDLLFTYAMGVFPTGALLNHSCAPTCVVMYDPATHIQTFRCLRAVAAGEEVTHAYLDIALPCPVRQAKLLQQYQFRCLCPACSAACTIGDPTLEAMDSELAAAASLRARGISYRYSADESMSMLAQAYPVYRRRFPPHHVDRLSLTCHYLNLALEAADWRTALPLCEEVIEGYAHIYPPYHPMLGLQYCTLADIKAALHDPKGFTSDLREAHRLLAVSHGAQNALVQSIWARLEAGPHP